MGSLQKIWQNKQDIHRRLQPLIEAVISILDIAKDPDDIFYDAAKKEIYVSCGEGFINIFQQQQQQQEDANHYNAIASIPTAPGARTSLFASELNSFYLAVPHLGNQESEILVYQVG